MFNDALKRRFLAALEPDRVPDFERLFDKAKEMEASFGKDLCECDLEELTGVLHHLAPESPGRAKSNKENVEAYLDWCIGQQVRRDGNPLHERGAEWSYGFVTST